MVQPEKKEESREAAKNDSRASGSSKEEVSKVVEEFQPKNERKIRKSSNLGTLIFMHQRCNKSSYY